MIIYVMFTVLSFLDFVFYQLLLKSYTSFWLVRFKSINVAKLVNNLVIFQKLKTFVPKANML